MTVEARPRILFAWEMGANYGHVHKISEVVRSIGDAAEVTIAARDVVNFGTFLKERKVAIYPAPFLLKPQMMPEPGYCYPGNLLSEGWGRVSTLSSLVLAWRNLFDLLKPDVLVVQAAPTALLASRGLDMKRVVLGSGFDTPPLADPMPAFAEDHADKAAAQDAAARDTANAVLQDLGLPPVDAFRDILTVDETLLCAWPETDHYGVRRGLQPDAPAYLGQIANSGTGVERSWKMDGRPRIFAYLRPGTRQASAGMGALFRVGDQVDAILACPGISDRDKQRLEGRGIQVEDGPVQLLPLLGDCTLGLTHASSGLGAELLRAGVPQIGLPTHREQEMYCRAIGSAGVGLGMAGQYDAAPVAQLILGACQDDAMRQRTISVAEGIGRLFPVSAQTLAAQRIIHTAAH